MEALQQLCACFLLLLMIGCTSTEIEPVPASSDLSHVTIIKNEDVEVPGFVDIIRQGYDRHNIRTSIAKDSTTADHEFTTTYSALRSWDLGLYLSEAKVRVWHQGEMIGSASYHLVLKGGLSPFKWQSAETKMKPVMDKLLSEYD